MENLIANISNENEVIEAVKSNPTILLERLEKDGRSLLHIAAGFGKLKLVELLIQMGSDLNAQDKFLESPIFRAVRFRKEDCVTALVQAGAKLDIIDYKGQTVLHRAFAMATSAIASVLMKYGADASIRDDYGQTALDLCKQSKFNSNQLNNFLKIIQSCEPYNSGKRKRIHLFQSDENQASAANLSHDLEAESDPINHTKSERIINSPDNRSDVEKDLIDINSYEQSNWFHKSGKIESDGFKRYLCSDGHFTSSEEAGKIDDWLYAHDLAHITNAAKHLEDELPQLFYVKRYECYLAYCSTSYDVSKLDNFHENIILLGPDDLLTLDTRLPTAFQLFK